VHGPYAKPKRNAGSARTPKVSSIIEGTFSIRCVWRRVKVRASCYRSCVDLRQRSHFANSRRSDQRWPRQRALRAFHLGTPFEKNVMQGQLPSGTAGTHPEIPLTITVVYSISGRLAAVRSSTRVCC